MLIYIYIHFKISQLLVTCTFMHSTFTFMHSTVSCFSIFGAGNFATSFHVSWYIKNVKTYKNLLNKLLYRLGFFLSIPLSMNKIACTVPVGICFKLDCVCCSVYRY